MHGIWWFLIEILSQDELSYTQGGFIMKYFILALSIGSYLDATRTSKELQIIYRITEQSSPIDKHKRSRSFPDIGTVFTPFPLQIMPPAPNNSLKDTSLDEVSVNIPDTIDTKPAVERQIKAIENEDKKNNGNPCTPTRIVVIGSICTAVAGVMTAIVTATVTLIVHFTTK